MGPDKWRWISRIFHCSTNRAKFESVVTIVGRERLLRPERFELPTTWFEDRYSETHFSL